MLICKLLMLLYLLVFYKHKKDEMNIYHLRWILNNIILIQECKTMPFGTNYIFVKDSAICILKIILLSSLLSESLKFLGLVLDLIIIYIPLEPVIVEVIAKVKLSFSYLRPYPSFLVCHFHSGWKTDAD